MSVAPTPVEMRRRRQVVVWLSVTTTAGWRRIPLSAIT